MTDERLRLVFRAIVLGMTAPMGAGAWMACSQDPPADPEAGTGDATQTSDAYEGGNIQFPDGTVVDSYVAWCEAGPPELIGLDPINQCDVYLYVPCGLPPGDSVVNDAGNISRCDQVCLGYSAYDCEVLSDAMTSWVLNDSGINGPFDAASAAPPGVYIACGCYNGGRRPAGLRAPRLPRSAPPLGAYLARMAHLEAASVPAFVRMHAELSALGAPRQLLARIARAVRDEQRHARVVGKLARRFGGEVDAARVRRFRPRSLEAMARENAVEGCVRELYGALVATWQARRAEDAGIRRAMASIAEDETRHAALSLDAARFFADRLDDSARRRVERARARAAAELYAEVREDPHPALVREAGLPSAADSRRLLDALRSTWSGDARA